MNLDALGGFGEPGFSPLVDVGNEILLPELRKRLATFGLGNSELSNSIILEVEGDTLTIVMAPYGKYVNFGVKGTEGGFALADDGYVHSYGTKRPPASVFARYSSKPEVQFAIATKIFQFGIRPRQFIPEAGDPIFARLNEELATRLADGLDERLTNISIKYES